MSKKRQPNEDLPQDAHFEDVDESLQKSIEVHSAPGNDRAFVIEPETGKQIQQTQERRDRALVLDSMLRESVTKTYLIMAEIVDDRLFVELGYKSAREYFSDRAIDKSTFYTKAQIGREIRKHGVLPDGSFRPVGSSVMGLGVRKWQEVLRNAHDQVESLIKEGKIQIDEEEYTAKQLESMTVRKLTEELKKHKDAIGRSKELEYELKLKEKENEELLKDNGELAKYRTAQTTEKEVRTLMNGAAGHMAEAMQMINSIDLDGADVSLQIEYVKRMNFIYDLMHTHRERHEDLFIEHSNN